MDTLVLLSAVAVLAGEALQLWLRRRALARANEGEAEDASDEAQPA